MKTNLIFSFLTALSLSLLTGCSSDTDNPSGGDQPMVKFTAEHNNTTRTSLSDAGAISWNNTDVVSVNGSASTSTFVSEGGAIATFTAVATPTYYVFYPASMVSSFNATAHTYSIIFPAVQTYKNAVSFSDNTNPAVAISENTYLTFSNVCGMLRLPISTNIGATKARFISNEVISGVATVNPSDKTLTVTGTGKTIDITSLPTTSLYTLNWVLPVRTYTAGWKIQLLDAGDNVLTEILGTRGLTIERSKITLATSSESQAVSLKYGIYFNGLYWAKGNLYAPTIASYQFATAQEAFGAGISSEGYYFCWNTLNSQVTSSTNATTVWNTTTDPCAKVVPAGSWRTPTSAELSALISSGGVNGTKNGKAGAYFGTTTVPVTGQENNYVFLPAAGARTNSTTNMLDVGTKGYYWSSTAGSTTIANILFFDGVNINIDVNSNHHRGCSVRCVSI